MDESYSLLGIPATIQVLEEYSVMTDYDADDGYETMKVIFNAYLGLFLPCFHLTNSSWSRQVAIAGPEDQHRTNIFLS
jgi:hypothetical protein